uniref:Uncharacterized protein n=1 Tax=Knipowitschia caucasica TaxID=637954 RepID=A0AAV2LG67_KNICA
MSLPQQARRRLHWVVPLREPGLKRPRDSCLQAVGAGTAASQPLSESASKPSQRLLRNPSQGLSRCLNIPPTVRLIRRGFNDVCTELIKRKVRFKMAFPAVLLFEINGMKKSFTEPKRARAFLGSTVTNENK